MSSNFDLFLFSTDPAFLQRALAGGIRGAVVDWEHIGKEERQGGADTQINHDTVDDVRRLRAATPAWILCRINPYGESTAGEIEQAIEAGATEILLPMVRTPEEVAAVLKRVRGRCGVGILVETMAAVQAAAELARFPLTRLYVGLNDLAIERKTSSIFVPLCDGTVERLRETFQVPFGFAGLTLPDRGHPIPCRLLIGEMVRLECSFSFLRRSFYRDLNGRDPAREIPRLLEAIELAAHRPPEQMAKDRRELEAAVYQWDSRSLSRQVS